MPLATALYAILLSALARGVVTGRRTVRTGTGETDGAPRPTHALPGRCRAAHGAFDGPYAARCGDFSDGAQNRWTRFARDGFGVAFVGTAKTQPSGHSSISDVNACARLRDTTLPAPGDFVKKARRASSEMTGLGHCNQAPCVVSKVAFWGVRTRRPNFEGVDVFDPHGSVEDAVRIIRCPSNVKMIASGLSSTLGYMTCWYVSRNHGKTPGTESWSLGGHVAMPHAELACARPF